MKGFVECKQAEQQKHHDRCSNLRCLFPGSKVQVRNYHGDAKWIPQIILKKLGPVTYSVDIKDGWIGQVRHRSVASKRSPITQVHLKLDR